MLDGPAQRREPSRARSALVTGANGFIGSHLVDLLVSDGWRVRCLVRPTSNRHWLPTSAVELCTGDVGDVTSLTRALEGVERGVDVVFHLAGVIRSREARAYDDVNDAGTANLARAAATLTQPPKRIVLVSSLAAGGPSAVGQERRECDPDAPHARYGRSKRSGEKALAEHAGSIPWTIVRPPAVYGARDVAFRALARAAARGWAFRISGPEQRASVIEVRDLVRALVAASASARTIGQTYYVCHPEPTSIDALGRMMGDVLQRRMRTLRWPRALAPPASWLLSALAGVSGRTNLLTRERLASLLAPGWVCSAAKAQTDFDFTARVDLETGLRHLLAWYQRHGAL